MKGLNNDKFEIQNLVSKKLILLNDVEDYTGSFSVLKAIVGEDSLSGRIRFVQGAFEVNIEGMVLIIENHPIQFEDETDAIARRIRILKTKNKTLSRIPLIQYDKIKRKWLGVIGSELGSIFHWAITMDDADKYLNDTINNVPSLREDYEELLETIDPLSSFITQQLSPGKGTYIGFYVPRNPTDNINRNTLYPTYYLYCQRRRLLPILSFRKFGNLLVDKLKQFGYTNVEKIRKRSGIYVTGVQIQDFVFLPAEQYGAPEDNYADDNENDILQQQENEYLQINKRIQVINNTMIDISIKNQEQKKEHKNSEEPTQPTQPTQPTPKSDDEFTTPTWQDEIAHIKQKQEEENNNVNNVNQLTTDITAQNKYLYTNIYNSYLNLLKNDTFKNELNNAFKTLFNSFSVKDLILHVQMTLKPECNYDFTVVYLMEMNHKLEMDFESINAFGCICCTYKCDTESPNIIATNNGEILNNLKKPVQYLM